MSLKRSDKIFFWIQGITKNIALPFFSKLRPKIYKPFFKALGDKVEIHDNITFKYPSQISIGNNVKIAQNCFIVGLGGLTIGNHVMIGADTKIVTTNHNSSSTEIPMINQGLSYKSITIEDDVWLGFNVIILSGSHISKGSIIGANAVLPGIKTQEYSIMAGIPARLLKFRNQK